MGTTAQEVLEEQLDIIKGLPDKPKNAVQDNYTRFYAVDREFHHDMYLDKHYNGMCILGLAPSHPIRMNKMKIKEISFELGKRTASSFEVSGKKKTNAVKISKDTKLCKIYIEDKNDVKMEQDVNEKKNDEEFDSFVFEPKIFGKAIQINKRLMDEPNLIVDSSDFEGWIVICESINYHWSGRKDNNAKKRKTKNVEEDMLNEEQ